MSQQPEGYIPAAKLSDIPECGVLAVEMEDRFLVLVRIDGEIYCLDDVCTHDGGPLGEGELVGHCIACPRHGAQFDVRTGRAKRCPPQNLQQPTSSELKATPCSFAFHLSPRCNSKQRYPRPRLAWVPSRFAWVSPRFAWVSPRFAWVSTHLPLPSLGRVEAEERG